MSVEAQPHLLPHVQAAALKQIIDPARAALLVIDVQRDFAAPDGMASNFGANLSGIETAIDHIEALTNCARQAGVALVFVRLETRPETDSEALKNFMRRSGDPDGVAICRAGSPGADYYRLKPQGDEIEVAKPLYSSFHQTELDSLLRQRGVETLILTGITTECCVDSTARDAFHRNYNLVLVSDACAAYDPALHHGSLRALSSSFALLADTAALIDALSAR